MWVVQGPDAGGARYTLLGFVQHTGTMRSGHYEACVQRGITLAHCPSILALLHKHGIAFPEESPPESVSSSKPSTAGTKTPPRASAAAKGAPAVKDQAAKAKAVKSSNPSDGSSMASKAQKSGHDRHTAKYVPEGSASAEAVRSGTEGQGIDGVPEHWDASIVSSADVPKSKQEASTAAVNDENHVPVDETGDTTTDSEGPQEPSERQREGHSGTLSQIDLHQAGQNPSGSASLQQANVSVPDGKSGLERPSEIRTWYCISDAQVRVISEADVLSREAYILMYMRVS